MAKNPGPERPPDGPFSLLIKPASADCNQRCAYCFYLDRASLYPGQGRHRMTGEILERLISTYMATDQPQYVFGWQGGEPALMGIDFFRQVTALQRRYGRNGSVVANGLQTNATLLDDKLCAHLGEYRFLVGVSLDGPADVHDANRKYGDGRGTHAGVLRGLERLRRHEVEFNVLTVVSAANVKRGAEIYRYLRDGGVAYHQYIPCVEWDVGGRRMPYALDGGEWGEFLCAVFDEWVAHDIGKVSVRLFDAILAFFLYGRYDLCHMGGDCRRYFVVEHNGDIYPCDFYVRADLRLGNIGQDSWRDLQSSPIRAAFGLEKTEWPEDCPVCKYLPLCSGDCLKHRPLGHPRAKSWLCDGWRIFYAHALPRLQELAWRIRSEGGPKTGNLGMAEPGRNAPCFCGSGRKFKKCHGEAIAR